MENKNTSYMQLCDSVFAKIKDYDFIEMTVSEAYGVVSEYISPAILMFEDCNQDLQDRDDEIAEFNFVLSDKNFQILSNYMVICYLDSNYIKTSLALKSTMSSTDWHKYDNKDMLSKVIDVRSMYKNENDQLMINYTYKKSSIFDAVINRSKKGV